MHEVPLAVRQLGRRPTFSAVVVLTLALGIGASTAIFSIANALFFRPLPYREAGRLIEVLESRPGGQTMPVDYPNFLAWRGARSLEAAAIFQNRALNLTGSGPAEQLAGAYVSATFFKTLGVAPALGRDFAADEDRRGAGLVAVLSHQLWQQRFAGSAALVGTPLRLNGRPVTVVGVLPPGFRLYRPAEVFLPIEAAAEPILFKHGVRDATVVVARLRAGVTRAAAQAELDALYGNLESVAPDHNRQVRAAVVPLRERVVGRTRTPVLVLLGAVGVLLLISCVNVANLLLARAVERRRETAVRLALGAGRVQVARPLLAESLLLSLAGAVLGTALAASSLGLLERTVAADLRLTGLAIDLRVCAFTVTVSVLAGVLIALLPTLLSVRVDLTDSLHDGARQAPPAQRRLGKALVVAEVALALVLLAGAGLLVRSFGRLVAVDAGIEGRHALTAKLSLPPERYTTPEAYSAFWQRAFDRLRAIPGIEAVGFTTSLPLSGASQSGGFLVEGRPSSDDRTLPASWHAVSPGYFRGAGIPLVAGRYLEESDSAASPPVAVINRTLARTCFPGEDPLGRRIHMGPLSLGSPWMTIVGVVGDTRHLDLSAPPEPEYYFSALQLGPWTTHTLVVRTSGEPLALAPALRAAIREVDGELPLVAVQPLESYLRGSVADRRANMLLLAVFSLAALLLATVGVCGVVANAVARRTQEIGLRVALGARRGGILGLVLGQGMRLVAAGIALGLAGAFLATRLLRSMLYGVDPADPATLAGAAVVLALAALFGSYWPARRALAVDPIEALRCQ